MGMRGHLRQLAPAELEQLQQNPKSIAELVQGKGHAGRAKVMAALDRAQKIKLDAQAAGALNDPAERELVRARILKELAGAGINVGVAVADAPTQDGLNEDGLNLEISWHVLHYLLTGEVEEAPPPLGERDPGREGDRRGSWLWARAVPYSTAGSRGCGSAGSDFQG